MVMKNPSAWSVSAINVSAHFINRFLFRIAKFPPIGLSFLHFIIHFMVLLFMETYNHTIFMFFFEHVKNNKAILTRLGILYAFSVIFHNMSLATNPIVVNIIAKNLILNISLYNESLQKIKNTETNEINEKMRLRYYYLVVNYLALMVVLFKQVFTFNTIIIFVTIFINAYYNVYYMERLRKLKIPKDHLLTYQSAIGQWLLIFLSPLYDPLYIIQSRTWCWEWKALIVLSGFIAMYRSLKLAEFSERTSASSRYNLINLSHLIIVLLDWLFIPSDMSWLHLFCLIISESVSMLMQHCSLSKKNKINYWI